MIPVELVEKICFHLDLDSVCALSQTSRFWQQSISDTVFQHLLLSVCPWFEPALSHHDTWRDCVYELQRRLRPGAKFCPKPSLATPETNPTPSLDSSFERLNDEQLLVNSTYTSRHGIQVDLRNSYVDSLLRRLRDEVDFFVEDDSKVVSLPHALLILYLETEDGDSFNCVIVVKLRNSAGLEPDSVERTMVDRMPYFHTIGNHVFLVLSLADIHEWNVLYLAGKRFVFVLTQEGECPQTVTCYDGLIQYFSNTEFYASQVCLNGSTVVTDDNISPLITATEPDLYQEPLDTFNEYSLVTDLDEQPYIYNSISQLLVPALRDNDKFTVQW